MLVGWPPLAPYDLTRIDDDDRRGGRTQNGSEGYRQSEIRRDDCADIPSGEQPERCSQGSFLHAIRMPVSTNSRDGSIVPTGATANRFGALTNQRKVTCKVATTSCAGTYRPYQGIAGGNAPVSSPSTRRTVARSPANGQSLAEFALILPVLLLILMFALDFGRVFYSWVTVTNASRVAANYAATNPDQTYPNADYTAVVQGETPDDAICPVIANTYDPTFVDGPDAGTFNRDLGDSARVSVSCNFRILTPIIGSILSNSLVVSASSTFPIRPGVHQ